MQTTGNGQAMDGEWGSSLKYHDQSKNGWKVQVWCAWLDFGQSWPERYITSVNN